MTSLLARAHLSATRIRWLSAVALSLVLAWLCVLKLTGTASAAAPEMDGAAGLLTSRVAAGFAIIVELSLAVLLQMRHFRHGAAACALVWSSLLLGLFVAMLVSGVPTEQCGCFGGGRTSPVTKAFILAGMTLLALGARGEEAGPAAAECPAI